MKLNITKEIPIMTDFPIFIDYLEENEIQLTRTKGNLKGPDLYQLNQLMSQTVPDTTKRSQQRIYPVLHLFYHLVLKGKLFKVDKKGSKLFLVPTERLKEYKEFMLTEKYIFLLETLWVDCNWDELEESRRGNSPGGEVEYLMGALDQEMVGKKINCKKEGFPLWRWGYFLIYFAHFGFWKVDYEQRDKYDLKTTYRPEEVEISDFGFNILKILVLAREFDYWNLPQRKEFGDFKGKPGAPLSRKAPESIEDFLYILGERNNMIVDSDEQEELEEWEEEGFIEAFIPVFAEGELQRTFAREEVGFKEGSYTFKAILNRSNWCRIKVDASNTLHDLHRAISSVFDFWDDHLYSFFMDGRFWSKESISDPRTSGLDANDCEIGDFGLEEGQEIAYIFDFGTEWRFKLKLEEVDVEAEKLDEFIIIEQKLKDM